MSKKRSTFKFRGGAWRDQRGHYVSKEKIKRWRIRKRKRKIGIAPPPIPRVMWRVTFAINFVSHHRYYALRLQRWAGSLGELKALEGELEEKILKDLESRLGFSRENWWFPYQVGSGYQPVPYDPALINREEIALELLRVKLR